MKKQAMLAALAVGAIGLGAATEAKAGDFHVGVFGGFASGETDWTYLPPNPIAPIDTEGGMYGINAGVGKTLSSGIYVGAEIDYAAAEINGDNPCPNPAWTCAVEVDSLITLRARLGREAGPWLFYGTIGAAWGDVRVETFQGGPPVFGETNTRNGYALGFGVERDISPNLSLRAEYMHYDLGEGTSTVDFGDLVDTQVDFDSVRLGINWNF